MKVFLSYASEDRELAHTLADDLRQLGHDVYPAAPWPSDVEAALRRADAFVVLLSPASVASPFVNQEIKIALVSQRLENRLIPLIVRPSTQVPWILRTMHPIKAVARSPKGVKAINDRLQQSANIASR